MLEFKDAVSVINRIFFKLFLLSDDIWTAELEVSFKVLMNLSCWHSGFQT